MQLPDAWSSRTLPALRRALLTWFEAHKRPMPWRTSRDPYRIWVSEVMLQQTTVAAVVPYFERFLASFPTVRQLAEAEEQAVLAHWQGLGYYRRARHLHAAAKALVASHGDVLPADASVWAELPGVGRYILGAVMSQAFEQKFPIVEANSLRVLARWFGYRGDPRVGAGQKWVWSAAEAVLPEEHFGNFNQAMMELGSQVCTPMNPKCSECPVAQWCEANRLGEQAIIPPRAAKKAVTEVQEVAVILRAGESIRLFRRPDTATRGAGLWEFPHGEVQPGESLELAAERITRELTGFGVKALQTLMTATHTVTRFHYTTTTFVAESRGRFRSAFYSETATVHLADVGQYPVSSPQRIVLQQMGHAT
jgi:A/G-specific adenine glycosylase